MFYYCGPLNTNHLPVYQKGVLDSDDSDDSYSSEFSNESTDDPRDSTSHEAIFRIALIICPIWFGANCLYNYSLLMTTVSSSTIISNLSGPFTLLFSWLAGVENSSCSKWVGIGIGLVGVALVAYADDTVEANKGSNHTIGDFIALLSSAGYGLYTTVLKVQVPHDNAQHMQLLLGYLGLINSIALLPFLVMMITLQIVDIRKLSYTVFAYLLVGGVLDNALSDYLWARSVGMCIFIYMCMHA